MRAVRRRWRVWSLVSLVSCAGCVLSACSSSPRAGRVTSGPGARAAFACRYNVVTDAYAGAGATASAIGWEGNHQGVVTCLGGSFYVQGSIATGFGFHIYDGSPTNWTLADGYLPAQITSFHVGGAAVSITEFADRVVVGSHPYVAVYCRVEVQNHTGHTVRADPGPSPGLVELSDAPTELAPHSAVHHDYVVAVDRFGHSYPWPPSAALAGAGGYDAHFAHMRAFWDTQLAGIAELNVPDRSLVDAYKSGFVYTQIARSGDALNTGVNGYEMEFSHDVIGILASLFTEGYFTGAHALLTEARNVVGSQAQYPDGVWTYAWPWAVYLLKTGDVSFVKANFSTPGPLGATLQPSIEDTAHTIAAERTGPGGIMGLTNDIDTEGYWTVDDYEALMGLAAYGYLARRVGDATEAQWASSQYDSLLAATGTTLSSTIAKFGLDYLPCAMFEPNTADRCSNPQDANWAAPFEFGKWAWDAPLFGAAVSGPGLELIDTTYDYGFARLNGVLPAGTVGGFPPDFYSTAYNAAYGSWGLASAGHRDQGILGYQFMITHSQSGPYSWWESDGPPSPSPWVGSHPGSGQGSSPHAWGISQADKVLLDSLVAQRSDGSLIVGRGVPSSWLRSGDSMTVSNVPTMNGGRVRIAISASHDAVTLTVRGRTRGPVLFELPSFVDNVASASAGAADEHSGTVTLPAGVSRVTVTFRRPAG